MPPKAPAAKPFKCPFARCTRAYSKKSLLKDHVGGKSLAPDEAHPASEEQTWAIVRDPAWMKIATRPGLQEEEAEARRSESRKVGYQKSRPERLAKSQANRDELRGVADAGTAFGDVAAPLVSAATHWAAAKDWQETMPAFEVKVPPDTEPSVEQFFNMVTYLTPIRDWPQPANLDPAAPPRTFAEAMPTAAHYKALCLLCHPDKRPELPAYSQQMLNDSWIEMKRELEEWSAVETALRASGGPADEWCVPKHTETESFVAHSAAHRQIFEVYRKWFQVYGEDMNWYICQSASMHDLKRGRVDETAVASAAGALGKVTEGKQRLAARDARRPKRKISEVDTDVD